MRNRTKSCGRLLGTALAGAGAAALGPGAGPGRGHDIRGIEGTNFNLYASPFNISLPEGSSLYMWGFGDLDAGGGATHPEGNGLLLPQYPAPTLIVTEGEQVTINAHQLRCARSRYPTVVAGGQPGLPGRDGARCHSARWRDDGPGDQRPPTSARR